MRIYDRYVGKQVLFTTISGVVVLSLVLVLGNLFKEIRPLLVESGAPLGIILRFILWLLPFSLMFTVPWGFLTSVLLIFGRLSADNEITSLRMAGWSLWRISAPVLALGFGFSLLCYWINTDVSPRAKREITDLLVKAAAHDPKALLVQGQTLTRFSGQQLLIDKRDGDNISGLHIYQTRNKNQPELVMHARDVNLNFDQNTRQLRFDMQNVFIETSSQQGEVQNMLVGEMPWLLDLSRLNREKLKAGRYTNDEIEQLLQTGKLNARQRAEFSTELTRRMSFSMACLMFGLIAVPLAMQTRRKDTSTGFAIGMGIAAAYFVALILADLSRKNSGMLPHVLLWLPNVAALGFALYMYRRIATKG